MNMLGERWIGCMRTWFWSLKWKESLCLDCACLVVTVCDSCSVPVNQTIDQFGVSSAFLICSRLAPLFTHLSLHQWFFQSSFLFFFPFLPSQDGNKTSIFHFFSSHRGNRFRESLSAISSAIKALAFLTSGHLSQVLLGGLCTGS